MSRFPPYKVEQVKKGKTISYKITSEGRTWHGPVRSTLINLFMADMIRREKGVQDGQSD